MLRDVFYYGKKPNVHPREKPAKDLVDARRQATTEHFWIINEFCDYKNFDWDFDFEFLADSDVWAKDHNNVWPSVYQKDSGTWLCPKQHSDLIVYRSDVHTIQRKKEKKSNCWVLLDLIDETKFDFGWHPDPTDPPYIYKWGSRFCSVELKSVLEYRVPGASQEKYMPEKIELLPEWDKWHIIEEIDKTTFDFTWRPDPREPEFIYVFGNHLYDGTVMPTVEYRMQNATVKKYINEIKPKLQSNKSLFQFLEDSDGLDYSWRPDPTSPPYIYAWGNQWNKPEDKISVQFVVSGATEYKYMEERAIRKPCLDNWITPDNIDDTAFDYSWEPSPADPPFIYEFGTQWQKTGGPSYIVSGATQIKYIDIFKSKRLPSMDNWTIPNNVDVSNFDFSWHPDDTSPPYIYHFATQWAMSGGPIYTVLGATEAKYLDDQVAKMLPCKDYWQYDRDLIDEVSFDFSWHPYIEDQPYIYQFGTQWQKTGGPIYKTPGVHKNSPIKYIDTRILKAIRKPNMKHWKITKYIDTSSFDFSWHPDETEQPYIYVFGTQWQKTGGPEYIVSGAKETKYIDDIKCKRLPNKHNYIIPTDMVVEDFDFSWHPDDTEKPYIYQFPTKYSRNAGPRYVVPNATEINYINDQTARLMPNKEKWIVPDFVNQNEFDFSWKPDISDKPYIYQFGTQWQKTGGPRYVEENATEVKYVSDIVAKRLQDKNNNNWKILIDVEDFDFSWHPDDTEPPYIYVFGNQWNQPEVEHTIYYIVPGATEYYYVHSNIAKVAKNKSNWKNKLSIVEQDFDYSWRPNPKDPPYIYQFGTQHQKTGGPQFIVEGATQIKYVDTIKAKVLPNKTNWEVPEDLYFIDFDYSWHPDDTEPPFIYQYVTQWALTGGPRYVVPGATDVKFIEGVVAKVGPNKTNWEIPNDIAEEEFDFSWHPYADDEPFIYQFGTQHQKTGGPRFIVKNATTVKYIDTRILKARKLPKIKNWIIPSDIDVSKFDFSWHPDETLPPKIYQFGTENNKDDGPKYVVPNNNGEVVYLNRIEIKISEKQLNEISNISNVGKYFIETNLDELVAEHPNEIFWALNKSINYEDFNFDWKPESIRDMEYVQVFGSPESTATHTYFVNANYYLSGNKNFKFIDNVKLSEKYLSKLFVKSDMFFVDKGNKEAQQRFEQVKAKYGNVQKTRYLNSWSDTINRCLNRSTTQLCWILNSELDYTDFNFEYYPNPWQLKMVHVFGTQWSHWGTTFMVNKESFTNDTKHIKIIEHLNNLNFVKETKAKATKCVYDIILIDHGNSEMQQVLDLLKTRVEDKEVITIKYCTSYLDTFKNLLTKLPVRKEHFVWMCSSICDYNNFDFSYICDPYAKDQLHVFPSDNQKFGDTFFVDINKMRDLISNLSMLENYNKVNYNQTLKAKRKSAPIIVTKDDTHVDAIKYLDIFPYTIFVTEDNKNIEIFDNEPMSLWEQSSKNIIVTSIGGTRIIVPKEAKDYVKTQLYDYPYIKKTSKLAISKPLDIVFLSNGETQADENFEHLLKITKGLKNKVTRVDGVNGRVQAYHAAANASETPWAFTVFAKLKVSPKFDWNWQPDRLQIPKHYIFQAKNPLNGLIYGHQAMIAYNKKLTLQNTGNGLDFTMDDPHEVVELLSGTAHFNTDEFSTWRTAFREVIKLRSDPTEINVKRMEIWLNKAEGEFSQWSIMGAKDAIEYFDEVSGNPNMLKLSYEWAWLEEAFNLRY